ncbi:hypothetical protein G3480_07390 [Thiorhodococcus mannitoliphagus]|uniref:Uncharacterized protein n=1 Tax=Thiorhodococcus mannitoliphagus TaxID=329406 RepID=A0A6P1DRH7_9GAMM|nr:hypothetical protein [Thiorhodococcus mannitoliphagus]NEX20140.1 hypothetical protein [Thiorhodococcus mannitoliphagus]
MSEPIKNLRPVHAQTPSRALADEHESALDQQRTWVVRKERKQDERRQGERRRGERRNQERRADERRSDDRRDGNRLSDDRRTLDRRAVDRRKVDRRGGDRRSASSRLPPKPKSSAPFKSSSGGKRRRGIIDDYA